VVVFQYSIHYPFDNPKIRFLGEMLCGEGGT
jgi:hypothetical protein